MCFLCIENNAHHLQQQQPQQQQPPNIQELQILSNQQLLMTQILQQQSATQLAIRNLSYDERVLDSLSSNMAEFVYDKDNGHTFDAWFSRYVDLFDKDARKLDDAAKVRLLLRKLSPPDHERYNSFILPRLAREFTFTETVDSSYLAYSCKVNKACVDSKLPELTEEQFKCLIYVCGLKSNQDAEVRMHLINKLNENVNLTLQKKKKQPSTKTVTIRNIIQGRKFFKLQVNNVPLRFQLDTGSDISIISHRSWIKLGRPHTKPTVCTARTASGEPLDLVAEMWCNISLNGVTKGGKCFVAAPNVSLDILGIDWMDLFGLWNQPITSFCNQVSAQPNQSLATLQAQFPEGFTNEMGLCKKAPVKLVLKGDPKPVFKPKRPVAYCMEGVVEDEICRLENLGILKKVDFAEWAAPIVVVRKPNGTVRICADFSTGLNTVLEPNQYPLPLPEDIFAKMSGCRVFSHIDLSDAYLQVEVDPESQPLLTINTHKGLFQFTRLSPGIKSAPGAFQQLMDTMLAGLPCTVGYLDDIVVGGRTEEEHRRNLFLVLQRLQAFGFTVRIEKCSFHMRQQ
ncbi:uncharacterized protein K02A2.6-like [Toxorhynchites rutilus septentrionalis]|uniref:uncharacterized protein K02A2.6-like n=1 Tax=Toxorhynchites rutilus septentrionalis TaxID=329112 RepID=UPI002479D2BD|nr:uncharacterized protein K02A2.6-like [Toxorhynchites rutilus septentrionalis]